MAAHHGLRLRQRIFNGSWTVVDRGKARSLRPVMKRTVVRFFPEYSRAKRLELRFRSSSKTKTRDRKRIEKCSRPTVLLMPISHTRRSMAFATGKVEVGLPRVKRLGALLRGLSPRKF